MTPSLNVNKQVPEFVRQNYPLFLAFVKAYYKFMETDGPLYFGTEMGKFDLDRSIDLFVDRTIESLYSTLNVSNLLFDKRFTIKHLNELLETKGTEESFRILFRLLFDEEIVVSYPRESLFSLSSGHWLQRKSLKATLYIGESVGTDVISKQITGTTSGATAIVEDVISYAEGSNYVYEFFLDLNSISGTFAIDEYATINGLTVQLLSVLSKNYTITNPGTGYSIGDKFFSNGVFFNVATINGNGAITSIKIISFGSDFNSTQTYNLTTIGDGNAVIIIPITAVTEYFGEYVGVKGQLSNSQKLQDSFYWQQFSYVIRSSSSVKKWGDIIKSILHPAGSQMFGEIVLIESGNLNMFTEGQVNDTSANTLKYRQVKVKMEIALGITPGFTLTRNIKIQSPVQYTGGFTYEELDAYKFKYPDQSDYQTLPTQDGVYTSLASQYDMNYTGTTNQGYWNGIYNTKIEDFGTIVIQDIYNKPHKVLRVQREPFIKIFK